MEETLTLYENTPLPLSLPLDGGGRGGGDFHSSLCPTRAWWSLAKIKSNSAKIGVIGMGYVGLPLVIEFCRGGFPVTGFDIDVQKIALLREGQSYIRHIDSSILKNEIAGKFRPTDDFSLLHDMDCILICVPTPINKNREPDMQYVFDTAKTITKFLRKDQLIVLESTTYPGTTDQDMRAILEKTGLKAGIDFYLAFSPEREDPNNRDFCVRTIPKVIGGYTPQCLAVAQALPLELQTQSDHHRVKRPGICPRLKMPEEGLNQQDEAGAGDDNAGEDQTGVRFIVTVGRRIKEWQAGDDDEKRPQNRKPVEAQNLPGQQQNAKSYERLAQ